MKYLGITHEEVGKAIAGELWNFPDNLLAAIGSHHNVNGVDDEQLKRLIHTTKLSEYICNQPEYGYCDFSQSYMKEINEIQRELSISDASVVSLKIQLSEEFKKLKASGLFN